MSAETHLPIDPPPFENALHSMPFLKADNLLGIVLAWHYRPPFPVRPNVACIGNLLKKSADFGALAIELLLVHEPEFDDSPHHFVD